MDQAERQAPADHWQSVYAERAPEEVSWFEAHPAHSLELIEEADLARDAALVDVGGGASSLAAHLLDAGYSDLTVADIAASALTAARERLGARADEVTWVEADVLDHDFGRRFDLWHDRAVFHFMTDAVSRQAYLTTLERSLMPGGHLVMATFGPEGPTRCSGLPTDRYGAESLQATLGEEFDLVSSAIADHMTPSRRTQQFIYAHFTRRG